MEVTDDFILLVQDKQRLDGAGETIRAIVFCELETPQNEALEALILPGTALVTGSAENYGLEPQCLAAHKCQLSDLHALVSVQNKHWWR